MGEYRLSFTALPWLNSNQRIHWREGSAKTAAWRNETHWRAKAARLPRGLVKVRIDVTLRFPDKRRRDAHNYMPSLKAATDGLVDYGLIPDDSTPHLEGPFPVIGEPLSRKGYKWLPPGVVELVITDLSGEAA